MPDKASVLIVDEEEKLSRHLRKNLARKGYSVLDAFGVKKALRVLAESRVDVVLLDISLPGRDGISILKQLRRDYPRLQVIVLTGNATVETALESMKLGAYDYLSKPCSLKELCLLIDRAHSQARVRGESELLRRELAREFRSFEFVGDSPMSRETKEMAGKAADCELPVLIQGETGTGKEVVARMIHTRSRRREQSFVAVNCSAFQDALLESEVFGFERGAFTDAIKRKLGLVELADEGTLFLDEIGEMSAGTQVKLLRFLDSGDFRRVGGGANLRSDARIISATNIDIDKAIKEGRFRSDLYYRLNVMTVRAYPLRERKDDIPVLAAHFLRRRCLRKGKQNKYLSQDALAALEAHFWPGNVRELENIIERAFIFSAAEEITRKNIEDCFELGLQNNLLRARDSTVEEMERVHILRILSSVGGNKAKAARILDIDTKTLYNKLGSYGASTSHSD